MAENHHPDLKRPVAAVLLVLLVAGFFWKLVLTNQFTWLGSPDLAEMYLPRLQFMANEWQHGRVPLWDPNQYAGQPLLAQSQPGVAYPLNWILLSAPLRQGWIRQVSLHGYFILTHILAAFAAYRLARDLHCRRGPALLAGCVYSLSGWMGSIDWPDVLNGGVWLPLVVMHVLRALRGQDPIRAGVFGGFFLGLSYLAGHHQVPLYTALACAGLWLASPRRLRVWGGAVLFYATAAGLAMVQLLPTYEYAKRAVRWVGLPEPASFLQRIPIDIHQHYQFRPSDILGVLFPGWWTNADPFLGSCALILAVLGIALAWQRSTTKALAFLGLGALLYSMSGYSVFHGFLYSVVPGLDKARNSSHAIVLFHLAASALSAVGLQAFLDSGSPAWVRRLCRAAAIFAGLAFAVYGALALTRGVASISDDRVLAVAMAALAASAMLYFRQREALSSPACTAALIGLFLFEAGLVTTYHWRGNRSPEFRDYYAPHRSSADIADFLRRQPGHIRVDVDDSLLHFNFGDFYGIPQLKGFVASVTSNLYRQELHTAPALNLFGVEFAIRKQPDAVFRDLVFASSSGLNVYRNPEAFPRAWTVHEVLSMPGRDLLPFWIRDASKDWRHNAFTVGQPPALDRCEAPDRVDIGEYRSNAVLLRVNMTCQGMVVLSDTMYPGWEARIDQQPAKVYEVYGSLRGVVVPAGAHQVEFRYRPRTVYQGAGVSLLTLAGVAALARRRVRA